MPLAPPGCRSPWPDLDSMRGKVMFVFLPRSGGWQFGLVHAAPVPALLGPGTAASVSICLCCACWPSINMYALYRPALLSPPPPGSCRRHGCPLLNTDSNSHAQPATLPAPNAEILGLYEELHPQAEGALLWLSGGRSAANQSHTVFYSGASWGLDVGQDIELPTDVSDVVSGGMALAR